MPNRFKYDFLSIHNDDLIPLDSYEGITVYAIDYESAINRHNEFIRSLILLRKKNENSKITEGE